MCVGSLKSVSIAHGPSEDMEYNQGNAGIPMIVIFFTITVVYVQKPEEEIRMQTEHIMYWPTVIGRSDTTIDQCIIFPSLTPLCIVLQV